MELLLKQMMEQMNNGFDSINKRLDKVEYRLDNIDGRLEIVENRLDNIDCRLEIVENRLDNIEYRLDRVEESVESLRETVENNAVEFRSHFRHIEEKLDHHDKMFELVSGELINKRWL